MVVVGDNRVEYDNKKVITRRVNGSLRGMNNEDSRICITSSGGVKQNSDMNKGDGVVEGIMIVDIPREDNEEDE